MIIATVYASTSVISVHLPIPIWIPVMILLVAGVQIATLCVAYMSRPKTRRLTLYMVMWIASIVEVIVIIEAVDYKRMLPWILESIWQSWFRDKEGAPIRTLQDRLDCCGLRSNVDRAWPFPDKTHNANACLAIYGRTTSCFKPCESMMSRCLEWYIAIAAIDIGLKVSFLHSKAVDALYPSFFPNSTTDNFERNKVHLCGSGAQVRA